MGKISEGRLAGHHITPGQGWRWQYFGSREMLVTDGGGADVVLSARHVGQGRVQLITCGSDGLIKPVTSDTPMGRLLVGIPAIVAVARDFVDYNDRPRQLAMVESAFRIAGLAE